MPCEISLEKIVSGGQTGADTAALDWAISHAIAYGGWCPKGRKSESGPIDQKYLLTETTTANYLQRTEMNVVESDATIIFTMGDKLTGGSLKTQEFATQHGKPVLHFRPGVHPKFIRSFLVANQVRCLNVAGSRGSTAPGIIELVTSALDAAGLLTEKST